MRTFTVKTGKTAELVNITTEIQRLVTASGIKDGIVAVFVPHTTAGVTINEGADLSVREDIIDTMNDVVPWERVYGHAEGNSPAHIKTSLFGSSEMLILEEGRIQLGQWQQVFLCELDGPRERKVWVKVIGSNMTSN